MRCMSDVQELIESGLLELYVLEQTSVEETREVERMAALHVAVQNEIYNISSALERYALDHAVEPGLTTGPFLMATIDYMERLRNGEQPASPPILSSISVVADYDEWLAVHKLPEDKLEGDLHISIIGNTPQATTAIVWLKYGSPPETHINELEQFLIIEGSCDIVIGNETHSLVLGSHLSIPLHISHHVRVTSPYPCKVILQRMAA